jgi:hypothetical protein
MIASPLETTSCHSSSSSSVVRAALAAAGTVASALLAAADLHVLPQQAQHMSQQLLL